MIGPDGDSPYQIVMTGGGPMVGISKKGMKLSKIVILGGRNDFEKFSFAVSRDFIQEFMYILWLDTEIFSQPFLLIPRREIFL